MAQMNLSAALTNPYTQTVVDVYRREAIEDPYGDVKVKVTLIPKQRGVLVADRNSKLENNDISRTVSKGITIVSKFALRSLAGSYQPDLILWRGTLYTVDLVSDYGNFGPGFVQAWATAIPNAQPPAVTQ